MSTSSQFNPALERAALLSRFSTNKTSLIKIWKNSYTSRMKSFETRQSSASIPQREFVAQVCAYLDSIDWLAEKKVSLGTGALRASNLGMEVGGSS